MLVDISRGDYEKQEHSHSYNGNLFTRTSLRTNEWAIGSYPSTEHGCCHLAWDVLRYAKSEVLMSSNMARISALSQCTVRIRRIVSV